MYDFDLHALTIFVAFLCTFSSSSPIDVLFLVKTWHDSDDVCLCRLRGGGFHVVDVPRPRAVSDTVATNHSGIAAVAFTGARLELLDIGATPSTFEFACVRLSFFVDLADNNNNNNNHDDIYSAVIMTRSLREFTRFIW